MGKFPSCMKHMHMQTNTWGNLYKQRGYLSKRHPPGGIIFGRKKRKKKQQQQ
jgi:hypothetical protein